MKIKRLVALLMAVILVVSVAALPASAYGFSSCSYCGSYNTKLYSDYTDEWTSYGSTGCNYGHAHQDILMKTRVSILCKSCNKIGPGYAYARFCSVQNQWYSVRPEGEVA